MRFRVTSVASEETGERLRDATARAEDWLNASLGDGNFGMGVDQFTIVAIAVEEDPDENARWANTHNKTGRFKNPFTGERVSYISIAVLLPPATVISKAQADLMACFCSATIQRLEVRPKRVPKGFDYFRCATAISKALAVYVKPVA